jgi:hypothetical protein
LVTPYTSYLATDGTMANIRQDAPMALDMKARGATMAAEKSGAGAVRMSVQQNSMQSNIYAVGGAAKDEEQILVSNSRVNQFVANKSFTNLSTGKPVWVDSEFSEGGHLPEVAIRFASDAYFDLATREPGIAPYLALGENVVVVWKGKVYRITS